MRLKGKFKLINYFVRHITYLSPANIIVLLVFYPVSFYPFHLNKKFNSETSFFNSRIITRQQLTCFLFLHLQAM